MVIFVKVIHRNVQLKAFQETSEKPSALHRSGCLRGVRGKLLRLSCPLDIWTIEQREPLLYMKLRESRFETAYREQTDFARLLMKSAQSNVSEISEED